MLGGSLPTVVGGVAVRYAVCVRFSPAHVALPHRGNSRDTLTPRLPACPQCWLPTVEFRRRRRGSCWRVPAPTMVTASFRLESQFSLEASFTASSPGPRDADGPPVDTPSVGRQPEPATRRGPSPSSELGFWSPDSAAPAGIATGASAWDAFRQVDGGLMDDGPPTDVFGRSAASDAAGGWSVDAPSARGSSLPAAERGPSSSSLPDNVFIDTTDSLNALQPSKLGPEPQPDPRPGSAYEVFQRIAVVGTSVSYALLSVVVKRAGGAVCQLTSFGIAWVCAVLSLLPTVARRGADVRSLLGAAQMLAEGILLVVCDCWKALVAATTSMRRMRADSAGAAAASSG